MLKEVSIWAAVYMYSVTEFQLYRKCSSLPCTPFPCFNYNFKHVSKRSIVNLKQCLSYSACHFQNTVEQVSTVIFQFLSASKGGLSINRVFLVHGLADFL